MKTVVLLFFTVVITVACHGQQGCFRIDQINTVISYLAKNKINDVYFWQSCYGVNALKTKLHINSYSAENCGNNLYALKIDGTLNGQSVSGRMNVNDLYIPNGRFAISIGTLMGVQTSPCYPQIELADGQQSQNSGQNQQNVQPSTNATNIGNVGKPSLYVSVSSLNFGDVKTGNMASRNFVIRNTGTATLVLTGVKWSNRVFTSSQISSPIAVGGPVLVTLYFQPTIAGQFSDMFTINSNAGNVTISLSGQGLQPQTNAQNQQSVRPAIDNRDQKLEQQRQEQLKQQQLEQQRLEKLRQQQLAATQSSLSQQSSTATSVQQNNSNTSLYAISQANRIVQFLNSNNIKEILVAHCYNGKVIRDDYYLNCIFKSEGGKVKLAYATQNNPISGNRAVLPNELDISRTFIKVNNKAKCLGVIVGYNINPCADNFYWNENEDPQVQAINQFNQMVEQKRASDYVQQQQQIQKIQQLNSSQQKTINNSNSLNINDFDTRSLAVYSGKIIKVTSDKFVLSVGVGYLSANYDVFTNTQTLNQYVDEKTQKLAFNIKLVDGSAVQVSGYPALRIILKKYWRKL
ncbi:MAG: choice-of-anchor D domain-containing protein [Niabella sp.]